MDEMNAIRVHRFGGPEVLAFEQTPLPEPSGREALIRVCAAGVGPWDALVRSGHSGVQQTLPLTPGADIAGVVERIADDSDASLRAGDAVYGVTNASFIGGYAQYAAASLSSIAPKPASLTFADAAGVPVVAVTAWQMLFDRANVNAGETVLVLGAGGNVGAYVVQLAHSVEAHVVGVAHSKDAEYLRGLGADRVIDSATERFEELVTGVDAVIDTIGGETQERSFAAVKRGGVIVSSVSPPSAELAGRYGVRTAYFIVAVSAKELERIGSLIDDGALKTDLGIVLGLARAREAHEMLAGALPHPRGKIVLDTTD